MTKWKTFIPEICNSSSEIVTNIFFQRPFSPILAQKLSCCFYKEKKESPLLRKFSRIWYLFQEQRVTSKYYHFLKKSVNAICSNVQAKRYGKMASTIWSSLLRIDRHWIKWRSFPKWRHFPNDLDHLLVTPIDVISNNGFNIRNDVNRSDKQMVSH